MDKDALRGMVSEIEKELENLRELQREMKEIETERSIVIMRSKGSILHDFYNCCEGYSRRLPSVLTADMKTPKDGIRRCCSR